MNTHATAVPGNPANRDPVTGFPTFGLLAELLAMAVPLARSRSVGLAVLSIELDGFDQVCRTLGHEAADELLRQAAGRLRAGLREPDILARREHGGFIVVLQDIVHETEAGRAAQILFEALSHPFDLAGLSAKPGASIGLAIFPGDGNDAGTLLRNAELAMHNSRAAGRRLPGFFDPAMQRDSLARCALVADLQQALEKDELVLHFQPVLRLPRRSLAEVEALIRWDHPEHGLIGPEVFLPTAEDSGLIKPIGRWVIAEACRQVGEWRMQNLDVAVSVNVSARQLADGIPPDWLSDTMARAGVLPRNLSFDFNEQMLQADDPLRDQWLEAMERMQIRIGLDDFGAGDASLTKLKDFNIRQVKIGRSLVAAIRSDSRSRALVKSVVDIGRSMMIRVTAAGVEDDNTLATLHSMGCERVQGFHLACPGFPEEIAGFAAIPAVPAGIPPLRRLPDPTNALAFV